MATSKLLSNTELLLLKVSACYLFLVSLIPLRAGVWFVIAALFTHNHMVNVVSACIVLLEACAIWVLAAWYWCGLPDWSEDTA